MSIILYSFSINLYNENTAYIILNTLNEKQSTYYNSINLHQVLDVNISRKLDINL